MIVFDSLLCKTQPNQTTRTPEDVYEAFYYDFILFILVTSLLGESGALEIIKASECGHIERSS